MHQKMAILKYLPTTCSGMMVLLVLIGMMYLYLCKVTPELKFQL